MGPEVWHLFKWTGLDCWIDRALILDGEFISHRRGGTQAPALIDHTWANDQPEHIQAAPFITLD